MSKHRFILASSSPRRLNLLNQIHITPTEIISPDCDEAIMAGECPLNYVRRIAQEKCYSQKNNYPKSWLLSADTIVCCGQKILSKTDNIEQVKQYLNMLSGRRHKVYTSFYLIAPSGKEISKTVQSIVSMKRLTQEEIHYYLSTSEWKNKAGGYSIQEQASCFIKFISGSYTNIVGLPTYELYQSLKGLGYGFSK